MSCAFPLALRPTSSPYTPSSKIRPELRAKQVSGLTHKARNNSPDVAPIKGDEPESSKQRVQRIADRIRAMPSSKRADCILDAVYRPLSNFNDYLMALVVANEPKLALNLFSMSSKCGLVPDSWTLSIVIRCHCKNSDPGEARRVLDIMMGKGLEPDVVTFTILIDSFCKRGKLAKAFEVLEVMGRVGCEANVTTHNCLIRGLCYVGRVEEALELLSKMNKSSDDKPSHKPDIYTYTALMDGLCKVGLSGEAMELLGEAMGMGLTPNVVTYNTLFQGFCREGRPLEGTRILKQMKNGKEECRPDCISYNTLIHGLLKWGEARAAFGVYKEMVAVGFDAEEGTANALLRVLCRRSLKEKELLKDAYDLFGKMRNGICVIYPWTYEAMVRTLCFRKELDKALAHFQEFITDGHRPKMVTCSVIIRALCVAGRIDDALMVSTIMSGVDRIPSKISYGLMIDELNRQGRAQDACKVYDVALKLGMIPKRKLKEFPLIQESP